MALRVLYFRAFVYHSLTCDPPLEVFVVLNGDTGDVYLGKLIVMLSDCLINFSG